MSTLFTNSLLILERAMNLQWTKSKAIADNTVNGETPNYKAKYVTFERHQQACAWTKTAST